MRRRILTSLATTSVAALAATGLLVGFAPDRSPAHAVATLDRQDPTAPPQTGAVGVPGLPAGFTVTGQGETALLRWSATVVRIGGARPEFRLGDAVVGYPREVDGGLQLALGADAERVMADATDLQVWSGGRRIDVTTAAANARTVAPDPSVADPTTVEPTPVVDIDPAAAGQYRTKRYEYDLMPLAIAEFPAPVEVVGEVTRPVGAPGKRPLVVILHGRHGTCYQGGPDGQDSGEWPCPEGWSPIPSHLGYRYLTDALASQGYIAVSISANGINGQDYASADGGAAARSQLIRYHLDLWSRWSKQGGDPWSNTFKGKVDLSRVVLVGHSRGGEGVNRAAIDVTAADPYRIRGLVSYGPTAFGRQVTPDVHSATLLPSCDGDVSDLQGQAYIDGSRDIAASAALRSAVLALGANHNYFNTEWTPGLAQAPAFDDWFDAEDPVCGDNGSLRLTPAEQQDVGAAYTLALVRLALRSDAGMLPLLDGTRVKPSAIGRAEVSISPVGGDSVLLYRPEAAGTPTLLSGMTGGECPGYLPYRPEAPEEPVDDAVCGEGYSPESAPHWQPIYALPSRPAPQAAELAWAKRNALARFRVGTVDLTGYDTIDLRIANDPGLAPAGLKVRIRDTRNRIATLSADVTQVAGWPGTGLLDRVEARTVRGDLDSADDIDLTRIRSVEVVSTSASGRVWVLDITAARQRIVEPTALDLPRLSVDTVVVPEGPPGSRTVTVDVRLERPLSAPASFWVGVADESLAGATGFALDLPAAASGVVASVPVSVEGDDIYTPYGDQPLGGGLVAVAATSGAVTGDYLGGVTTVEDDPVPTLSVDAARVSGAEGESLSWTLRLSQPSAGAWYSFVAVPPVVGETELDTDDLDRDYLERLAADYGIPVPQTPVPLSQFGAEVTGGGLPVFASFAFGEQVTTLDLPLRFDRATEGQEAVELHLNQFEPDPTVPEGGLTLLGVVAPTSADDPAPDWTSGAVVVDGVLGDEPVEEAALDAVVADARVILAGQATSGTTEFLTAKTDIAEDLIERGGLTDVIIDQPVAAVAAAARYVALGEGTADEAVAAYDSELARTVEAVDLLERLRAHNQSGAEPVFLSGTQPGPDPAALVALVADHSFDAAASIGCFDLDPAALTGWATAPEAERAACRAALIATRDQLSAEVVASASVPRTPDAVGVALAHSAAVALVGLEATASVGSGAADVAARQAADHEVAIAAAVTAALARDTQARVLVSVANISAGRLRDVAVPQIDGTTVTLAASAGALLSDELGADAVRSVGFSFGAGSFNAFLIDGPDVFLGSWGVGPPAADSYERQFQGFGPDGPAFVLPLGSGAESLAKVRPLRTAIGDYFGFDDAFDPYVTLSLPAVFDGVVHYRTSTPSQVLSLQPSLILDGADVEVTDSCFGDVGVEIEFAGGNASFAFVADSQDVLYVALSLDGVAYTGEVAVDFSRGYRTSGILTAANGTELSIEAFVPFDLQSCGPPR